MKRIAVAGAGGRMGQAIVRALASETSIQVVAASEHSQSKHLGEDVGRVAGVEALGVAIQPDLSSCEFDLLVDFTQPDSTMANLTLCESRNAAMVIGTTGLDEQQKTRLAEAGQSIPVLLAANTSVGVNLCAALVETAAKVLGSVVDVEIVESHHRHKVDAPSGTALFLGECVARALDRNLDTHGVFERYGQTGARPENAIGFSTIRGGDIAGEHTVMFIGESERLEITHRATDRKIFARGAVRAIAWLANQPKGFYDMRDALGLGQTGSGE